MKKNIGIITIILAMFQIFLIANTSALNSFNILLLKNIKKIAPENEIPEHMMFIKKIDSGIVSFSHDEKRDLYSFYNTKNELKYYVLLSSPHCDDIRGWGGIIPFAIVLSPDLIINQIFLFQNSETPSWIEGLKKIKFFDTWNGMDTKQAVNKKVDAISGSTLTSDAIIKSMQKRLSNFNTVNIVNNRKSFFRKK